MFCFVLFHVIIIPTVEIQFGFLQLASIRKSTAAMTWPRRTLLHSKHYLKIQKIKCLVSPIYGKTEKKITSFYKTTTAADEN